MQDFEKLKEYTKKVSLNPEEKLDILQNIRTYSNTHPIKSSYYSVFVKHSLAYSMLFAIIIGTSATSFAAERSLPGDILYPIKTEVNEKVAQSLSLTKNKKAKTNVKLVEKRMSELTELVVTEKDNPEKIDLIAQKLEEHREDLEDFLEEIQENNTEESEEAVLIAEELATVVDAHIDILEEIKEDKKTEQALNTVLEDLDEPLVVEMIENDSEDTKMTESSSTTENKQNNDEQNLESNTTSEDLAGEEDALFEIVNFSSKLEPILGVAKSKTNKQNEATSTQNKIEVRKKIIEATEQRLNIDLDTDENSDEVESTN